MTTTPKKKQPHAPNRERLADQLISELDTFYADGKPYGLDSERRLKHVRRLVNAVFGPELRKVGGA